MQDDDDSSSTSESRGVPIPTKKDILEQQMEAILEHEKHQLDPTSGDDEDGKERQRLLENRHRQVPKHEEKQKGKESNAVCWAEVKEKIGEDCGLGATVKFDFGDDGILFLDATQSPNVVSNDDNDAQCTMVISMENFMEMAAGNLDGTSAFMTGKLKIQGDMGIAMKLGPMLS